MAGVYVDNIQSIFGSITIPVTELKTRVIQHYQSQYTGGDWNPDNNYNWVPGAYAYYAPKRSDSRIRYVMRIPTAWSNAGHAISHWNFYANGVLYYTWSESGTYIENGKTYEFEIPSWGTNYAYIGIQMRAYANDNHEVRAYRTYYWNGGGSVQNCYGHLIIQEISV